jgi:predicted O-methyltransferase YrrM
VSANTLAALAPFLDDFSPEPSGSVIARERGEVLGLTPVSGNTAATLTVLAKAVGAKSVVEIGTGTGVSALALLAGMPADGVLTSIDPEQEYQLVAREVLTREGVAPRRFRLIVGLPLNVLPNLADGSYDLLFVNGDPLEFVEYVEQAQRLLRSGGLLVLNHALWQGKVPDLRNDEDEPIIIREALEAVGRSDDFTAALLPVGDGLLVAVKG